MNEFETIKQYLKLTRPELYTEGRYIVVSPEDNIILLSDCNDSYVANFGQAKDLIEEAIKRGFLSK